MRVYLPNDSEMGLGGGWTFRRNLAKAAEREGTQRPGGAQRRCALTIVEEADGCDVALVCGATMVTRATWRALVEAPCKVILRVDGVPEDWRNRGTGWPRLRDFATEADAVVYQSQFVHNTTGRLLGREGRVIYNGVDTEVFTPEGDRLPRFGVPSVLCVGYRKDPNKRVEEVIEKFRQFKLREPGATLMFVGQFPSYLEQWGFGMLDLVCDRDWRRMGVVKDPTTMATIMRSHDRIAFPSFADPCPNTLIEALACGCQPLWVCDYGGAAEIVMHWESVDWSLGRMGREYGELFDEVAG